MILVLNPALKLKPFLERGAAQADSAKALFIENVSCDNSIDDKNLIISYKASSLLAQSLTNTCPLSA
jgi:hypothetical protein